MKTAQESYTITIKRIVRFHERMHLKIFKSIKFKMAAFRPLLAPAVTVGDTEGAMDSASVLVFTSSFAYNFVRI